MNTNNLRYSLGVVDGFSVFFLSKTFSVLDRCPRLPVRTDSRNYRCVLDVGKTTTIKEAQKGSQNLLRRVPSLRLLVHRQPDRLQDDGKEPVIIHQSVPNIRYLLFNKSSF